MTSANMIHKITLLWLQLVVESLEFGKSSKSKVVKQTNKKTVLQNFGD